jgi:hypothetical protein
MGEGEDHLSIGRPEPAGAVGQIDPDQGANDASKHEAAEAADEGLLIVRRL